MGNTAPQARALCWRQQGVMLYLHCSEQSHCSGIVYDSFSKDQAVQQGAAVLLQHLKHCHRVRCCKDDSKSQAVLQEHTPLLNVDIMLYYNVHLQ